MQICRYGNSHGQKVGATRAKISSSSKTVVAIIMGRTRVFVVSQIDLDSANSNTNSPKSNKNPATTASKLSLTQRLEFALSLLNRLLIGFVTIYMCWMCLRWRLTLIPWHALLCTVGFVCLMSEGLMAHYRGNAWTQLCYRTEKTRTHWLLQLCGSVIGLAGILVKLCLEEVHFHTLHGKLGLAAFILCLTSLGSGLSSLYANELKSRLQPLLNKALHNILGLAAYALAMLSMFSAFETEIFLEYSLDAASYADFRWLLQIMIVLILLLSSYGPLWCLIYSKLWKCC